MYGYFSFTAWDLLFGASSAAAFGTVGAASVWAATATRPRWTWRLGLVLLMLAPLTLARAYDLWSILALQAGIVIALLQALTQVQEMTLTFIPKIIAILVICSLTAPFMGAVIYSFAEQVYARIEVGF